MSDWTPNWVTDANGRRVSALAPDGRSVWIVDDEGRIKTVPLRFAGATPTPLIPPHPGRLSARTLYNLAAVRSELESLIHYANAYRTLVEGGTIHGEHATPHAVAAMLRTHVAGLTRCYWTLEGNADRDDVAVLRELDLTVPLSMAVDNFDIMASRGSVMDFASAASSMGLVGTYEYILRRCPAVPTDVQPPPGRTGPAVDSPHLATATPAPHEVPADAVAIEAPPKVVPEPSTVDFAATTSALRKAGKPKQAALVEYMADKQEATVAEVARHVHDAPVPDPCADGDEAIAQASLATMRKNVQRTNESLVKMSSRLSFRVRGGVWNARVFKDIASE